MSIVAGLLATFGAGCHLETGGGDEMTTRPSEAIADARYEIRRAADSGDPEIRANAMEAVGEVLGEAHGPLLMQGLDDEQAGVRFSAAMVIGDLRYAPARARLLEMVQDENQAIGEPDLRVLPAVIYALHRLGEEKYATLLGDLVMHAEPRIRANAVWAMGKLGEASARRVLRSLIDDETNPMVELNMVEALALLGDRKALSVLESYRMASDLDQRMVAVRLMGRINGPRFLRVLRRMTERQNPRVRIAAAAELAPHGELTDEMYEYALDALNQPRDVLEETIGQFRPVTSRDVDSLQQVAARALGKMGREPAVDPLTKKLKQGDPKLRLVSAVSVLRLLESYRDRSSETAGHAPANGAGSGGALTPSPDGRSLETSEAKD
jgi:HEAT repeat protein